MPGQFSRVRLRSEYIERRKTNFAQDPKIYERDSLRAAQNILNTEKWQTAVSVGLYMPIGGEVDTKFLCANAFESGKKVYFPRCHEEKNGHMDFIACVGFDDLERGAYGIYAPKQNISCNTHSLPDIDMLIVPGVCFDTSGYRIGFGGGYYDRFLQKIQHKNVFYVGLAFSWQIVDSLPSEDWDIPIHALATDGGFSWI